MKEKKYKLQIAHLKSCEKDLYMRLSIFINEFQAGISNLQEIIKIVST